MSLTEHDLDRLADYAAGVASDAAAFADVARLVQTDPVWTTAYRGIVEADDRVRRELHWYAETHREPMPGDIAAALDEVLRRVAVSSPQPQVNPRCAPNAPDPRRRATHPAAAPSRPVGRPGTALATRRRRRLYAGLAAAAAAVTVLAGIALTSGVTQLTTPNAGNDRAANGAFPTAEQSAGAQAPTAGAPTAYLASGVDYRAETLGSFGRTPMDLGGVPSGYPAPSKATSTSAAVTAPDAVREQVPPALVRLTDPVAVHACLDAVTASHPGSVALVDYARFNGAPALVVLVRAGTGATVVVVGPACGAPGADEKASAPA